MGNSTHSDSDRNRKRKAQLVEVIGLALVLSLLLSYLLATYSLKPYSDPVQWYKFGKYFAERFARKDLPYAFPLVVAGAIRVVGADYAFLVNIPMLVLLAGVTYLFAKLHLLFLFPQRKQLAMFGGALCLCMFATVLKPMLNYLSSPYRDPFSFVLVISACCFFIRFRLHPRHPLRLIVGTAICLALACSTRETSILAAPGLLLFAGIEKLRKRDLPFWKPMLVGGGTFSLACIPLAIQNYLIMGNAFIPAQAKASVERGKSLVPGIKFSIVPRFFEQAVAHIQDHYGLLLIAMLVISILLAIKHRNTVVLCVSTLTVLIYFMFYASYNKIVPRYFLVMDFFALPMMSTAAALVLSWPIRHRWKNRQQGGLILCGLAFALAAVLMINGIRQPAVRFRLHHAQALRTEITENVPDDAYIITERTLGGYLKCFTEIEAKPLIYISPSRALQDTGLPSELMELAETHEHLYALYSSKAIPHYLQKEFDLVPIAEWDTADYGLSEITRAKHMQLARVATWDQVNWSTELPPISPGTYRLALDMGRLSKHERTTCTVSLNNRPLDLNLHDYRNYCVVEVDTPGPLNIRVESDGPVPAHVNASIQNVDDPISMTFRKEQRLTHAAFLSKEFFEIPDGRYPGITSNGVLTLPTLQSDDALFIVVASIGLESRHADDTCGIQISAGDQSIHNLTIPNSNKHGGRWQRSSFALPPSVITENSTALTWKLTEKPEKSDYSRLAFNSIVTHRLVPALPLEIPFGLPADEPFVISGLHAAEAVAGSRERHWRWSDGDAAVRLVLPDKTVPMECTIRYLAEGRPEQEPLDKITFALNGDPVEAEHSTEIRGDVSCETAHFEIPTEAVDNHIVELSIRSNTWLPRDHGLTDQRKLGLMLHSVSVSEP